MTKRTTPARQAREKRDAEIRALHRAEPDLTQRAIADRFGVSVGLVNNAINAEVPVIAVHNGNRTLVQYTRATEPGVSVTPRPVPLADPVDVPPFPTECLPAPIAAMVAAVAEATQTDEAMVGTCALAALAACCGGHAEIEVRSGWREILVLFLATIADPANANHLC